MKKLSLLLSVTFCLCVFVAKTQNIGINNTNPQAALDLQGDLRLRSAILTLPAGLNNDVDLTTVKSSIYMFAGGALSGAQITGFTGGVDGRIITIFNNSTTAGIQLYDETNNTNISAAANKILTGTGNTAVISFNGSVTLRYDGAKQRWIILSSNNTNGLEINPSPWLILGNNIGNSNTANVGIGNINPQAKLDITGNIKITDGTQGEGKLLTSNANGVATWQKAAGVGPGAAGFGTWGDCATNANIGDYNPVSPDDPINSGNRLGYSVSTSGDFAAIGNTYSGNNGSVVFMYKYNIVTGVWDFYQKIVGPVISNFGESVSLDGNNLIIGATDDVASTGSASIYKNIGGVWTFQVKLQDNSPLTSEGYGTSVSINGVYAIVGCLRDDVAGLAQGSASVYKNIAGVWTFQVKLLGNTGAAGDNFGKSVCLNGDYAIVGANLDDDAGGADQGSASIYKNIAGVWTFQSKLFEPSALGNDQFGYSVSLSGDYAVVGAPFVTPGGSANIFKNIAGTWTQQARFTKFAGAANDFFGINVSINDNIIIVGDLGNAGGTGPSSSQKGAASIYKRLGNLWQRYQIVIDPAGNSSDFFGYSTSIDAATKRFLIGAPGSNSSGKGKAIFGKLN